MDDYFEIGKITGTHGIKGTFRVYPITEEPARFERLKTLTIDLRGKREVFTVKKVAYHKKFVLLTVKEIDDINVAEKYKNATILIPSEEALPLEENEYYARDLYDMTVKDENGEEVGAITDILFTGANDVYCVKDKNSGEEILLPAIKDCVLNVDVKNKVMTVRVLNGLRER